MREEPTSVSNDQQQKGSEENVFYIAKFNNKRNPDIIIPGGTLKGNMYFKGTPAGKENEQEHGTVDPTDSD